MRHLLSRSFPFVPLLLALAILPGCASILSGTQTYVLFETRPPGAEVYVDGQPRGRTPLEVPMRTSVDHAVQLQMPGYRDVSLQLYSSLNAVTLWNFLFWPGFIVDAVSGAIWEVDPDEVRIDLLPLNVAPPADAPTS